MRVKKQQGEPVMEQLTGSKLGKKYNKTVYCQLVYLTNMWNVKCQAGWTTSWNPDCWQNINNLRNADDTILTAESEEGLNLDKGERGE